MKFYEWDDKKNEWLMRERGISFEFIKECIESGRMVANVPNHSPYEHQKVFHVLVDEYIYEVPYVEEGNKIFLKTAYPSHEVTKRFRNSNQNDKQ